jgi:hypothetical protein
MVMKRKSIKRKAPEPDPQDQPLTSEYMIRLAESKQNRRLRRLRNWRGPGPKKGPGGGFSTFYE